MDSDRTTPTTLSPDSSSPEPGGGVGSDGDGDGPGEGGRKVIKFDDFSVSGQVVYRRQGVLVQARRQDRIHSGTLELTDTAQGVFVTWERAEGGAEVAPQQEKVIINDQGAVATCVGSPPSADWAVVSESLQEPSTPLARVRFSSRAEEGDSPAVKFSSHLEEKQLRMVVEVSEIKSYKLADDGNMLTIMMKDGTVNNNLIFLDNGPEKFLAALEGYVRITKSSSDDNLFMLTDKKVAALDQSLSELNLIDMMSQQSNSEYLWKTVNDFQKDPYTTGLTIFSKMADKILFSPHEREFRPEEEMAELLRRQESVGASLDISQSVHNDIGEKTDWQLVTNKRRSCVAAQCVETSRADSLCQLDWELHIDTDGVVTEVPLLLEKIFKGGVEDSIRSEVWKYLLGYYKWHQPLEVRETNRKARVEEYFRMKLQWKSMSDEQQNRFAGFRERRTQIEKDIGRTDRTHPFYAGDNNPNVNLLQDILMTYVMYNFDLGYVQGMSDLLSPILFVMKNEVDAFWCFVGFMDRVASNFDFDQGGIKRQLENLIEILKHIDPVFYSYLDSKESGNLYFCFRWLLIWFKREFDYSDTMKIWEVFWTKMPCRNIHLLFCAALLDTEKSSIVENGYGFTEILKHINDMSHRIDVDKALAKAEGLHAVLAKDPSNVSDTVINILGLAPPPPPADSGDDLAAGEHQPLLSAVSTPVPIQGRRRQGSSGAGQRERRGTESSNSARSSLNNSSSVEVLSEAEDEHRFESSVSHGFF